MNTDAGTMSPFEHGEVFVLDDGGEVCLSFFSFKLLENDFAYIISLICFKRSILIWGTMKDFSM